jgi:hypothetical protein
MLVLHSYSDRNAKHRPPLSWSPRWSVTAAELSLIWIKAAPAAPLARRQRRALPWRPARRTPGRRSASQIGTAHGTRADAAHGPASWLPIAQLAVIATAASSCSRVRSATPISDPSMTLTRPGTTNSRSETRLGRSRKTGGNVRRGSKPVCWVPNHTGSRMKAAKIGLYVGWLLTAIGGITQPIPHAHVMSALGYFLGENTLLVSGIAYGIVALRRGNSFPLKVAIGTFVFLVGFPVVVVAIATSGQIRFVTGYGTSWQFWLFIQVRAFLIQSVLALVLALPHYLNKRIEWGKASDQTKTLLPSWIAALAALATGGQIIMLHYYRGPFRSTPVSTVVIAALLVSALLAPVYKWVTRTVWIKGLSTTFSPSRWYKAISEVLREIIPRSSDITVTPREQPVDPDEMLRLVATCKCLTCRFHRLRCATCRDYRKDMREGLGSEPITRKEGDPAISESGDGPLSVRRYSSTVKGASRFLRKWPLATLDRGASIPSPGGSQGPGRSLPGPESGHSLQSAGGHEETATP